MTTTISKLTKAGDGRYVASACHSSGATTFLIVTRRHNGIGNEWRAADPMATGYGLTRKSAIDDWHGKVRASA